MQFMESVYVRFMHGESGMQVLQYYVALLQLSKKECFTSCSINFIQRVKNVIFTGGGGAISVFHYAYNFVIKVLLILSSFQWYLKCPHRHIILQATSDRLDSFHSRVWQT